MAFVPTLRQLANFKKDGFLITDRLIDDNTVRQLRDAFDELFRGNFETGVEPDEVNWKQGESDPALSRQICNGWKANRAVARTVLDATLAQAIATFSGWSGVRIMIDNVIWKAPETKSIGFHQDNAYLSWFDPGEIMTCWIALDDTAKNGGTIEFARGSHQWALDSPDGEFHAPVDYRKPMLAAAARAEVEPDICHVEVPAGSGSFHHGRTWHGSAENPGPNPRRALVLHAMPSKVEYVPGNFSQGIGPIYSRYKRLGDNTMDENYFPILWQEDGYRTPEIDAYLES